MKRILLSFAATFITLAASSQLPTTVKEQGLMGNVFSIAYYKYEYKENFGEPTEGRLEELSSIFFDEKGRSIMIRTGGVSSNNEKVGAYSYVNSYSKEGELTKVNINQLRNCGDDISVSSYLNSFNKASSSLENQYNNDNCWPRTRYEFYYDTNNVIVKLDGIEKNSHQEKEGLKFRRIAKPLGNGVYECTIYSGRNGDVNTKYKETYKNGLVVSCDNGYFKRFEYNRSASGLKYSTPQSGSYEYNPKGQLASFKESKPSMPEEYKYFYNDKGDLEKVTCGVIGKQPHDHEIYGNYKYDSNGNWIYRTVFIGLQKHIEKRVIEYCASADEIKGKVAFVSSILSKSSERDAVDAFYEKYLYRQFFEAKIPLSQYDESYATQKGADKITVTINLSFESGVECRLSRKFDYSSNIPFKMSRLVEQWNLDREERGIRYEFKDGVITIKGEQYKIDPNTGNLTNITKNYSFSKN